MQGREFLDLARDYLPGTHPRHRHGAIIHAYYALLLECRDTLTRWGIPQPAQQQVHAQVRLKLIYSTDQDLKQIGYTLDDLNPPRNLASYDLTDLPLFATPTRAQQILAQATAAIALLDSIDGDPARRAVAIASLPL